MAHVWKRPSLTVIEVAWRWLGGAIVLCLAAPVVMGFFGMDIHFGGVAPTVVAANTSSLQNITVFQPVAAVQTIQAVLVSFIVPQLSYLRVALSIAAFMWLTVATFGRTVTLRRLDRTLCARRFTFFVLCALRAALLCIAWFVWVRGLFFAVNVAIDGPAANGQEPNVVLFAALVICGSLLLYVLWGSFSWFLQLAPLLAMRDNLGAVAALRVALSAGEVRGKLIEINLVMNIVKIALIVLAMVFSASPLPFTTVATQQFLTCWWIGVILLYFATSNYFHVVRAASYLSLYNTYNSELAA